MELETTKKTKAVSASPSNSWTSGKDLAALLAKEDDFNHVRLVFYCASKQKDSKALSVATKAERQLENFQIPFNKLDCSRNSSPYCNGDNLPTFVIHRVKGDDIKVLYEPALDSTAITVQTLHYFLLDMPPRIDNDDDEVTESRQLPLRILTSQEDYNSVMSEQDERVVVYIKKQYSADHLTALQSAYQHGFALGFAFTHSCDVIGTKYRSQCMTESHMLILHHYYHGLPSGNPHTTELYTGPLKPQSLLPFLSIHTLPPVIPSEYVLEMYGVLEEQNKGQLHITFVVSKEDDFMLEYFKVLELAAQFRGMFAICHIAIDDAKLVAKVPEVKHHLATSRKPAIITRRSAKHRKEIAGTDTYEAAFVNAASLAKHLREVSNMMPQAEPMYDTMEGSAEGDLSLPELNEIRSVNEDEWQDLFNEAKQEQKHIFTAYCPGGCPSSRMRAYFDIHRSIQSDALASEKIIFVFYESKDPNFPRLAHHWFGTRKPNVYDGAYTFHNMMDFIDRYTGLEVIRQMAAGTDESEDDLDSELEDVTDEEDDEVVISAQKNFASGGMGYQTPVPVMTHDDFQEKNIEKINEVLVIHFANFFSPVSKAFTFSFEEAMKGMADQTWVSFRWVDCNNLHDVCQLYKIQTFPTVLFVSYPRITSYRGALESQNLIAAVHHFRHPKPLELQSTSEFSSLQSFTAPASWSRPLLNVTIVVLMESVDETDMMTIEALSNHASGVGMTTYCSGDTAIQISNGEELPLVIVLKHKDVNEPEVHHSLAGKPLDKTSLQKIVDSSAIPLVSELTAESFSLYRLHTKRFAILFTSKRLDDKQDWEEDPSSRGHTQDMGSALPPAYLKAVKEYKRKKGEAQGQESLPVIGFTWMYGFKPLAASVLNTYVSPMEIPSLLILDYEQNNVYVYSHDWSESALDVTAWIESYLKNRLEPAAALSQGKWQPQKGAYDFLSRAVMRDEAAAAGPESSEASPHTTRSRIPVKVRSTGGPDLDGSPGKEVESDVMQLMNAEEMVDILSGEHSVSKTDEKHNTDILDRLLEETSVSQEDGATLHSADGETGHDARQHTEL